MFAANTDFPLLNIFLTMVWFFFFVLWLMLLFRVFADMFQSDMSGVAKAVWTILLIVLPLVGVLAYLITRGDKMAQREADQIKAQEEATREYIRSAAGTTASPSEELARLDDLRQRGVVDDAEFATLKAKIVG